MKLLEEYIKHQFDIETMFDDTLESININQYASLVKISIKTIHNDISLKDYFIKYVSKLKEIGEKEFLSNFYYCTKEKVDWIKSEINKNPTKTYFKYLVNEDISFIPHSWKEHNCLNIYNKNSNYNLDNMNDNDIEFNLDLIAMYKEWFYLLTEPTHQIIEILGNIDIWIYQDMDFGFIEPIILTHRDTNKLLYRF